MLFCSSLCDEGWYSRRSCMANCIEYRVSTNALWELSFFIASLVFYRFCLLVKKLLRIFGARFRQGEIIFERGSSDFCRSITFKIKSHPTSKFCAYVRYNYGKFFGFLFQHALNFRGGGEGNRQNELIFGLFQRSNDTAYERFRIHKDALPWSCDAWWRQAR